MFFSCLVVTQVASRCTYKRNRISLCVRLVGRTVRVSLLFLKSSLSTHVTTSLGKQDYKLCFFSNIIKARTRVLHMQTIKSLYSPPSTWAYANRGCLRMVSLHLTLNALPSSLTTKSDLFIDVHLNRPRVSIIHPMPWPIIDLTERCLPSDSAQ